MNTSAIVRTLVSSLSESSKTDSAIESAETFFGDDTIHGVRRITVFWNLERIGQRMRLRLQSDLDDFHGCDDRDGFSRSSS